MTSGGDGIFEPNEEVINKMKDASKKDGALKKTD